MIRSAFPRRALLPRLLAKNGKGGGAAARSQQQQRTMSSLFEADSGALATHAHHTMTLSLVVLTPLYFLVPASATDGIFDKAFGLLLTTNISAHSWVGLNYVATDYVPKFSKALTGPARIFNVGIVAVTFLGLSRVSLQSEGGIRGVLSGLWNPPPPPKKECCSKKKK